MKKISTIALVGSIVLVLLLTACSTASKHEPAPAAAAPVAPMPKTDRN